MTMEAYTRNKIIHTIFLCFSYFAYGLGGNIVSAALLDIAEITSSSVAEISSWSFVIASVSYCSSAILCGYFAVNLNRHLFCTVCTFLSGLSRIAIPLSRSVVHYSLGMALTGFANGGIDVGVNSWLLDMWHGDQSNMYMQFLHFSYAFGSLISPFIAEPFLSYSTNETIVIFNESLHENYTDFKVTKYETTIIYPYFFCAFLQIASAAILLFLYFRSPDRKNHQGETTTNEWDPIIEEESESRYTNQTKILIITIAGCVLACESGMESNVFSYIQSFVTGHNYTKSKGAFVLSAMTTSFAVSRGLSGIIAIKVPMKVILTTSLILLSLANAILQILVNSGEAFLWLGFCVMGIGFGPFYAGLFSIVEKDIRVTTKICGIFVFMSSITSIIGDLTTGKLVEKYVIAYSVFNWFALMITIPLFILLNILLAKKLPKMDMDDVLVDPNSNVVKND